MVSKKTGDKSKSVGLAAVFFGLLLIAYVIVISTFGYFPLPWVQYEKTLAIVTYVDRDEDDYWIYIEYDDKRGVGHTGSFNGQSRIERWKFIQIYYDAESPETFQVKKDIHDVIGFLIWGFVSVIVGLFLAFGGESKKDE